MLNLYEREMENTPEFTYVKPNFVKLEELYFGSVFCVYLTHFKNFYERIS